MAKTHDSIITGNPECNRTYAIIIRDFYQPGLSRIVRKFGRNCDVCGHLIMWRSRKQGLLLSFLVPERFHAELFIDFLTDLTSKTKDEPKFLMVTIDR